MLCRLQKGQRERTLLLKVSLTPNIKNVDGERKTTLVKTVPAQKMHCSKEIQS